MRDLVFLAIVVGFSLYALKQPWVGVMLWTWISTMNPHQEFTYSAAGWPVAAVAAAATLLGMLFNRERHNPLASPAALALLAFTVWVCITLPFSLYFDRSYPLWERSMKIFLMIFVTIALIDTKKKLDIFIWICALSIAYFGIKGGVFTLRTGGNYRIWGPGGFIGGNNEIAVALIMVIPLMRYLQMQLPPARRWVRHGMTLAMLLCAVSAIGTYSRGGFLAIAAMALFLWLKSRRHKLLGGVLLVLASFVILASMPQHWWDRMDSIQDYQEDDSALGRINAWRMAWNLALNRVVGGGFSIYNYEVFSRFAPEPERVHAAHSIYFQVLGEHGFIGLFIFLAVGVFTWLEARRLIGLGDGDARQQWAADLGRMVQVSMVGFAVGGAFLSLAYWDLPYNLMAMVVCATYVLRRQVAPAVPQGLAYGTAAGRA